MPTVAELLGQAKAAHAAGQLPIAIELYERVLQANAGQAEAQYLLGAARHALGQPSEALGPLAEASRLRPDYADAHHHLGVVLVELGRLDDAIASFERAGRLRPTSREIADNLRFTRAAREEQQGSLLANQGDLAGAEQAFRRALEHHDDWAEAHNNLGIVLGKQQRFEQAILAYQRAVELKPDFVDAHHNLGTTLAQLGRHDEAADCFRRAVELQPDAAAAHHRLGTLLHRQGKLVEALASYDRAIALDPANREYHYNRAVLWLANGDFERGWPEYEWRPHCEDPRYLQPRWDGSDLRGQRIIIYAGQPWGLGDTLQFIRYVPLVTAQGGQVFLDVQPGLIPLLKESGYERFVADERSMPECPWQSPMLSLPGAFQTSLATIPVQIPYLSANAELVAKWRQRLQGCRGLKVGIHWRGSEAWTTDPRSIPLGRFEPLARIEHVTLISLQKEEPGHRQEFLDDRFRLIRFDDELDASSGAFMDTAAIMKNLDLVISCDTSVAHLAGGLGVPAWIALPSVCDWRWLLEREDSPWYPTMRLFRQQTHGDWSDVFQTIEEELARIAQPSAKSPQHGV